MSYITKEEFDAAIGGYEFLQKVAEEFAEKYEEVFVGGKFSYLRELDISADEITGDIEMMFEVNYCGCCQGDWETYTVPVDYLWDENWIEREKEARAHQQKIREQEEAKRKEAEAVKLKERRYQQYLKMREEFEGED